MSKPRQKGQGLVEFALILIPLLMLVLGIIEAARVFHAYLAVQHAAREAARYAVTGRPFDDTNPNDGPFTRDDATRVAAIKEVAKAQALGLTVDYWGLTTADYDANLNKPGFFGVEIHGFDSYDQPEKRDDPGQPGLPVRVRVVYNLVILDPLYRAIIPQIRLVGHAEMVNEGFQVGYGGAPPPTFGPTPTLPSPPTATPTATPTGPYIALDQYFVKAGDPIPNIYLRQHAPNTSYDIYWVAPGGSETLIGTRVTNSSGAATLSYTVPSQTESGTYTIQSRQGSTVIASVTLQVQGPTPTPTNTGTPEPSATPTETPTPTATPTGPYIALAGQYYGIPGEQITILLRQHSPNTTYQVYWITPGGAETLIDNCLTNDSGNGLLVYTIPMGSGAGTYVIESRLGGAFVARVNFQVLTVTPTPTLYVPPDLKVTSITLGAPIVVPGAPITVTVQISNSGGTTSDVFDVDLYVDPEYAPLLGHPGLHKQWQHGIAAGGTANLVFVATFYGSRPIHQLWAQVDTTNFVEDESDEDNNITGPVNVSAQVCYLDTLEPAPTPGWAPSEGYEGPAGSTNTGWRSPSANYAFAGGGFTNPSNAHADGSGYAARDNNADAVSHVYRDYGFNIPAGSTIQGIEVRLDWWLDNTAGTNRILVYLSWDSGNSWTAYRIAGTERTSDGNPTDIVGGSADTWGRTWSVSDFSNSNFRVRLELDTDNSQRDFRIDWVPVRVTYLSPGGVEPFAVVEPGAGYYSSATHAWWVDNADHPLQTFLDSPSIPIPSGLTNPTLSFWHRMNTQDNRDGGWLRYRIDGGNWQDVTGGMISQGGYTGNTGSGCPSGSHAAWEGNVPGQTVVVAIPTAAISHTIQFRWQFECDSSGAAGGTDGWWIDDVSTCGVIAGPEPPEQPKPPGLKECARVVTNGKFDNPAGTDPWHYNPYDTVWQGGGYPMPSIRVMRLNSLTLQGQQPFQPYLYQDITMPGFITTTSTATLSLYKKVCEPENCYNTANTTDPLYVVLRDPSTGVTLTHNITVALGSDLNQYVLWSSDVLDPARRQSGFDPGNYANNPLRLYFYAPNDGNPGTWFYVDSVDCEVCTTQPIPTPDPGSDRVTVGGLAQVLLSGVPRKMPGIDVYAYTADGELFTTYTIHDSTYHFYWVLPPNETIYIYAETYIGGYRYWTQTTVPPLPPGGQRDDVDLLLLPG